jgi:hypothetical protein
MGARTAAAASRALVWFGCVLLLLRGGAGVVDDLTRRRTSHIIHPGQLARHKHTADPLQASLARSRETAEPGNVPDTDSRERSTQ